ncbi:lytic polysaccharide monooxygenase [Venturia nashicola]|nr:lytic polysaccharide monooxygenase [Venturia nashicola]
MFSLVTQLALALAPSFCLAHYTLGITTISTNTSAEWQYVRMTENHYNSAPLEDPSLPAIRCFEDPSLPKTSVATMPAGSNIAFKASNTIGHPGPILFYMAKAPEDADISTWKADGEVWFKIYEKGATVDSTGVHFQTGMDSINATIPANVPAGDYLVRAEHIGLHKMKKPQFYIGCAQVRVTGGGSGTPGPLVAFPGAYEMDNAGISFNLYGSPVIPYPIPGPAVWKG